MSTLAPEVAAPPVVGLCLSCGLSTNFIAEWRGPGYGICGWCWVQGWCVVKPGERIEAVIARELRHFEKKRPPVPNEVWL